MLITPKQSLEKAIAIIGGQVATAKALEVSQPTIWKWLNSTKEGLSAEYVRPLCQAVEWQVTPHELRPDLYPHPHDGLPEHLRSAA